MFVFDAQLTKRDVNFLDNDGNRCTDAYRGRIDADAAR